ncbi:hypothetical protein C8J57DRAFT_1515908 [Mycena rebaudengoi]|nr:hypothetical protein C8J57DRAFT_1515908 [Mycena rebaudengoi]
MAESEAQPQPIRNPELWFSDGNLVIQAGNHQFRVFSGILAAKSPVFQNMFSFSQPPGSETVEESPLVRLPDSSEDTGYFLNAIFHFDSFEPCPAVVLYQQLYGILRLSQKYQVDAL